MDTLSLATKLPIFIGLLVTSTTSLVAFTPLNHRLMFTGSLVTDIQGYTWPLDIQVVQFRTSAIYLKFLHIFSS